MEIIWNIWNFLLPGYGEVKFKSNRFTLYWPFLMTAASVKLAKINIPEWKAVSEYFKSKYAACKN